MNSPELMHTLAWSLLHFLWQGAAIAALAAALRYVFRTPATRYLIGVSALGLMLLSFGVTFALLAGLPGSEASAPVELGAPAAALVSPHETIATPTLPWTEGQAATGSAVDFAWVARGWLLGVFVLALRIAFGLFVIEQLRRRNLVALPDALVARFRALQSRLGIRRVIRYCECHLVSVPAVIGFFRPVVLIPMRALTGLSQEQLEALVAHELGHIKRFDVAVNFVQVIAETLFFFHPAVWWLNKRIRADREDCCDDIAVAAGGNSVGYAKALATIATWRDVPSFAMAATGGPVATRIARLLGMNQQGDGTRTAGVFTASVILASALLAGAVSLGLVRSAQAADAIETVEAIEEAEVANLAIEAAEAVEAVEAEEAVAAEEAVEHAESIEAEVTEEFETEAPQAIRAPLVGPVHSAVLMAQAPAAPAAVPSPAAGRAPAAKPAPAAQAAPAAQSAPAAKPAPAPRNAVSPPAPKNHGGADHHSYVDEIERAGLKDLSVDNIVAFKVHGITPEFISKMRGAGLSDDPDMLIAMAVHDVTPEFAEQMRSMGFELGTDEIVAMKVHDVTPQYVKGMRDLGFKPDGDQIIAMKVHDITPEYVQQMRNAGFAMDADELIAMKIHDVTPEYRKLLESSGFKLSTDQVIQAKVMDITPEFVAKVRAHGFKDLNIQKIIALKNADVF
jgi:beta-lactamase regulating signal transducer with metallopeptidase domain